MLQHLIKQQKPAHVVSSPRSQTIAPVIIPEKEKAECETGQKIYVVWDAIGDGRVIGVFSDFGLVKKIHKINPHYYRYYECEFNRPLPIAVEWLNEDEKNQLKLLCSIK